MSYSNAAVKNELSQMEAYPERHEPMTKERAQPTARLDRLIARHGTNASLATEAGTGLVATVGGFVHFRSPDERLFALGRAARATDCVAVLQPWITEGMALLNAILEGVRLSRASRFKMPTA